MIIKAIVFSFYFSSKKLILAQMFIYYMNKKKNRSLAILKCVTQFNIIYDVIFDQSECVLLYVT